LLRRLRSPALRGIVTYRGKIVRGGDAMPLLREPVLPPALWKRLQSRRDANSKGAGVPRDAYAWLHVLTCRACGDDLYYQRWSARPSYAYLNHKPSLKRYTGQEGKDRCRCSFRAPDVEAQIEPVVMAAFGDKYVPEIIELPAEDHTEELEQVQESITDLERDRYERGLFRGEDGTRRYTAMMTKLEGRLDELKAQPVLPARREVVLSGELFRDRWESLATGRERGDLLRSMRVRLPVFTDDQGRTRVGLRQERPAGYKG